MRGITPIRVEGGFKENLGWRCARAALLVLEAFAVRDAWTFRKPCLLGGRCARAATMVLKAVAFGSAWSCRRPTLRRRSVSRRSDTRRRASGHSMR